MRVGNNLCTPTWTAIAPPILDEKGEKKGIATITNKTNRKGNVFQQH